MVRKWLGDPPVGTEVVGRPSQRFRGGRETLIDVRHWLGTLPEVQKWSETVP